MSIDHPAKPLFDRLAQISDNQIPVPTWQQFAASSTEARRVIVAIWRAHSARHVEAMLCLMKFTAINGPIDADVAGEFDHDGDGGRGHDDYMRDNGLGGRGGFRPLREIAEPVIAALPLVASPPLAPELSNSKVNHDENPG